MAVSIEEARNQVQTAREILEQKRDQAIQAQKQLDEQDKGLPSTTSQTALRQRFSGMQGRIQRQVIEQERTKLNENKGYVRNYLDELGNYENEINATEQQINEYARKYSELQSDAREEAKAELEAYQKQFEAENPGEKLIIDWSRLRVKGISSGVLSQSLSVEDYNRRIDELNKQLEDLSAIEKLNPTLPRGGKIEVTKNRISGLFPSVSAMEINPNTGRPYGIISPAKVVKGYKDFTNEGKVKGTLAYLGNKISGAIDRTQLKTGDFYQQEGIRNAGSILPSAVAYGTPYLGETLLVAGGTEQVIRNVPKIKSGPKQSFTKIGYGVADIGLGAVAGGVRLNSLRTNREGIALREATTNIRGVRFENGNRGLDIIYGIKQTKPSGFMDRVLMVRPQTAVSKVVQPFYRTKNGVLLENGRAYSVSLTGRGERALFNSAGFRQSGRVVKTPQSMFVREVSGTRAKIPIEANSGLGKVRMRKVYESYGTIEKNRNFLFRDEFVINQGKQKFGGKDYEDIFFGGFSKQNLNNKDVFNVLSGRVQKVRRYNDVFSNSKAIVRPNVKGMVRRFNIGDAQSRDGWNMFIGGMGKKSGKSLYAQQTQGDLFFSATTAEQAINKVAPKSDFAKIVGLPSQSEYYGKGTYEKTSSVSGMMPKQDVFGLTGFIETPKEVQRMGQMVKFRENTKKITLMEGLSETLGMGQTPTDNISFKSNQAQNTRLRQRQKQQQQNAMSFNIMADSQNKKNTNRFFFKPSVAYKSTKGRILHAGPGRYVVVVKRFGVDSIIGEASTLEESKRLLSSYLRNRIQASGFVADKSTGRKQDVSSLWGSMFTRAKRDPYRLVQRRGKRLSSSSEVSEILGFNKRSNRKINNKINWLGSPKPRKKSKNFDWWD